VRKINKRWALLAAPAPALTLTGALVAWALVSFDNPLTGSVTGEDASASLQVVSVSSGSENGTPCAWSRTADGKIGLDVVKAPSGAQTKCSGSVTLRNDGNVDLAVQAFTASSSVGTATAGFESGSCGRTVAPGATVTVSPRLLLQNVPVGGSGTLTGRLTSVDAASYSATACSPTL